MKTNKIVLLLMLYMITFSSCEDWLDVSPKADVKATEFYSLESGYRDALIGVYALMTTSSSYGKELSYTFIDVLAQYYDDMEGLYGYGNFKYAAKYEWESSKEESRLSAIWSRAYQGIANINLALKYIDDNKAVFSRESIFNVYKGEYLALRAYLHFDMLRLFSPSPKNNLLSSSIPYIDKYTSKAQARLSLKDASAKIIKDLKDAKILMEKYDPYGPNSKELEENVPDALKNRNYRMNYYAVTALLARVYLYIGNKELALEQAKELTGQAGDTESMPRIFELTTVEASKNDRLFNKELIFSISIDNEGFEEDRKRYFFNEESDYYRQNVLSMTTARKNAIYGSETYRSEWTAPTSTGSTYALSKYQKQEKIPLIRLSEMFLIAAECSTIEVEALWYLNNIRAHRGLPAIVDASTLKEEIYKEYKKEFIGEGQLYFFYKRNLYETIGSADDVVLNIDKAYVIPLPKSEQEFGKVKH